MGDCSPADADLLLRCLDDEADPDERRRLHRRLEVDPDLNDQLRATLHTEHLLQVDEAGRDDGFSASVLSAWSEPQRFAAAVAERHARRHWPVALAAAAALLATLPLALGWLSGPDPVPCRVTAVAGTVLIDRDDAVVDAGNDESLRVGDEIIIGGTGSLDLRHHDGTRLTLFENSRLQVLDRRAKHYRLTQGSVAARVTRQHPDHPLRIEAGDAEITVLGTAFTINLEDGTAELDVREGEVAVDHADGGRLRLSADGALRWDRTGSATRFQKERSARVFAHDWSAGAPTRKSEAALDPVAGVARPLPGHVDANGYHLMRISCWGGWPRGFGAYRPGDALRIRGRFERDSFMVCIVGIRRADESMSNLIYTIPGADIESGEHEVVVPIERFRVTDGQGLEPGARYMFYLLMPTERMGFELRECGIDRYDYREVGSGWE